MCPQQWLRCVVIKKLFLCMKRPAVHFHFEPAKKGKISFCLSYDNEYKWQIMPSTFLRLFASSLIHSLNGLTLVKPRSFFLCSGWKNFLLLSEVFLIHSCHGDGRLENLFVLLLKWEDNWKLLMANGLASHQVAARMNANEVHTNYAMKLRGLDDGDIQTPFN